MRYLKNKKIFEASEPIIDTDEIDDILLYFKDSGCDIKRAHKFIGAKDFEKDPFDITISTYDKPFDDAKILYFIKIDHSISNDDNNGLKLLSEIISEISDVKSKLEMIGKTSNRISVSDNIVFKGKYLISIDTTFKIISD